ncbi:class I adenylate-forming enzyme family protein [Lentzea flaviverrucosa]|uniref:Acyl-CoA synthetase (AMP-forming)/AMP-acid ligase II n=1 Tax=Lentzea flaviverrucosa TaxID=200379 RepID=A0A1H9XXT0_9PSEU|nr:class I adenylate-forming enzyme family protein [Lentzea flaviverrucosa]RDI34272.1 acyl-CoA synthetase (AMP-forming)/AMP-acid ligase II [Lentzea flaviverrucosa]SES50557.1 Acyl-CoA synthetase (AMP-forming)/AMP-acid ligase II [Lentzea flaviverrucosa]
MTWVSATGTVLRDLVPARLRRDWVAQGHCPDRDLHSLFRDRVREHPDRTALVDDEGELSYAELDLLVQALAARLPYGTTDIIGVQEPDGRAAVVAELAVLAVGAVVLPLPAGAGTSLSRAGASALITGGVVSGKGRPGAAKHARPHPEAPAKILLSSGSEAEPKMVAYSHNAFAGGRANYVRALHGGHPAPRDLVLVSLTSSFGSFGVPITLCCLGGTLILTRRFAPDTAMRLMAEHRPTHVFAVPTMWRRLADHPAELDLSGLVALVSSGDVLPAATLAACRARFGVDVITVYGSSDGVNCHTTTPENGAGVPDPAVCDIRTVDGEICARGPMTPLCYVGAPELEARHRLDGGWVRTGDRGHFDGAGRLHVTGRAKRVVIRGGYTISPAEVELAIGGHPSVGEVACVPVPDTEMGERLCAVVTIHDGQNLDLPGLTAFLSARGLAKAKLPEFLLTVPGLPVGRTGKICHRTVARVAADRCGATA